MQELVDFLKDLEVMGIRVRTDEEEGKWIETYENRPLRRPIPLIVSDVAWRRTLRNWTAGPWQEVWPELDQEAAGYRGLLSNFLESLESRDLQIARVEFIDGDIKTIVDPGYSAINLYGEAASEKNSSDMIWRPADRNSS